jgi:hypothetical protein
MLRIVKVLTMARSTAASDSASSDSGLKDGSLDAHTPGG